MQKILIYTEKITPRIHYIFDFVLRKFSGLDFELTTNSQFFEVSTLPKLNYSHQIIPNSIQLLPDDILFSSDISDSASLEELNPIGKLFYTLSRYEEYLPFKPDHHGRFQGKGKAIKTPFVDQWILEFQQELKTNYPQLEFKERKFELILTCDVDQVWKYKHKGFKRTLGAYLRDFIRLDFKELAKRNRIVSGKDKDLFDTFDLFRNLKEKYHNRMIFFWLMADYDRFDKNNPADNRHFKRKIKEICEWAEFGVHPSYASNSNSEKLKKEIKRLENAVGEKVLKSRQHYIKLSFPETYRILIQNGIKEDFTMAYADETGFRAGTCTPFFWYDLQAEKQTDLKIYPFCAMDVSMRNYMKLSKQDSIAELQHLKHEIQKVNGQMMVLFHNSNFHESWEGWDEVLESLFL